MSVSKLQRIIWHWSAGTYSPGTAEHEHYHFYLDGAGKWYEGDHLPEDNLDTTDDNYAAHVANMNTGSIGVAICAMAGAVESPFKAGAYPIMSAQIDGLIKLSAELCKKYQIPVSRTTTLSHAEVQPSLGVSQSGKWDISWLPGMLTTDNPVKVGDTLRNRLSAFIAAAVVPEPSPTGGEADLETRVAALEAWAKSFVVSV